MIAWTFQNNSPEALLASVNTFAAQGIIGYAIVFVQKEGPFLFSFFTHSWHDFSSFILKNEKHHG